MSDNTELEAQTVLLRNALRATCDKFLQESEEVPSTHWNESVFRFFLVRELLRLNKNCDCKTEWKRIDLVIHSIVGSLIIEIKFLNRVPTTDLNGKIIGWKGGPGRKNYREFEYVLQKLFHSRNHEWVSSANGVAAAYLILAFIDVPKKGNTKHYSEYYQNLESIPGIIGLDTIVDRRSLRLEHGVKFSCNLIKVKVE